MKRDDLISLIKVKFQQDEDVNFCFDSGHGDEVIYVAGTVKNVKHSEYIDGKFQTVQTKALMLY